MLSFTEALAVVNFKGSRRLRREESRQGGRGRAARLIGQHQHAGFMILVSPSLKKPIGRRYSRAAHQVSPKGVFGHELMDWKPGMRGSEEQAGQLAT